ncbi:MAG: hypothetical protein KDD45_08090 [Bdellovibrionales bacterium]|nr:hypothetical protein [Bdellovibrionales bacterium]
MNVLKLVFYNAYDKVTLKFTFAPKEAKVEIHSDCIKTLGNILQDLVEYIGV